MDFRFPFRGKPIVAENKTAGIDSVMPTQAISLLADLFLVSIS